MSQVQNFLNDVGESLAAHLANGFSFRRASRQLRREASDGWDVVALSGSNKYSPQISISFYMGRNFAPIRQLEKATGWGHMPFHVQQYSAGARMMSGLGYTGPTSWDADVRLNSNKLVADLGAAIRELAFPFFARFAHIRDARDAFVAEDSWCLSDTFAWHQLLKMDAALDDLTHFHSWSSRLDSLQLQQAQEMIDQLLAYKATEPNQPLHRDAFRRPDGRRRRR